MLSASCTRSTNCNRRDERQRIDCLDACSSSRACTMRYCTKKRTKTFPLHFFFCSLRIRISSCCLNTKPVLILRIVKMANGRIILRLRQDTIQLPMRFSECWTSRVKKKLRNLHKVTRKSIDVFMWYWFLREAFTKQRLAEEEAEKAKRAAKPSARRKLDGGLLAAHSKLFAPLPPKPPASSHDSWLCNSQFVTIVQMWSC